MLIHFLLQVHFAYILAFQLQVWNWTFLNMSYYFEALIDFENGKILTHIRL